MQERAARSVIPWAARRIWRRICCEPKQLPRRRSRRLSPKPSWIRWSTSHAPLVQAGARLVSLPPAPVLLFVVADDAGTLRLIGAIVQRADLGHSPDRCPAHAPVGVDARRCAARGLRGL